jgi:hypothetical protein
MDCSAYCRSPENTDYLACNARFLHPLNEASRVLGHRNISALFAPGVYAPCLHLSGIYPTLVQRR